MSTQTAYQPITKIPGAQIDKNTVRWPPDQVEANWNLIHRLGCLSGSLEPNYDGYIRREVAASSWRTLRDVPASVIEAEVRAAKATLDAPADLGVHDALDAHFARAYRRWERSG